MCLGFEYKLLHLFILLVYVSCMYLFPQLLGSEANRLVAEQPSSQDLIEEKQTEMLDNWSQLTERADQRKNNLLQSRELQRFLADLRDLVRVVV